MPKPISPQPSRCHSGGLGARPLDVGDRQEFWKEHEAVVPEHVSELARAPAAGLRADGLVHATFYSSVNVQAPFTNTSPRSRRIPASGSQWRVRLAPT